MLFFITDPVWAVITDPVIRYSLFSFAFFALFPFPLSEEFTVHMDGAQGGGQGRLVDGACVIAHLGQRVRLCKHHTPPDMVSKATASPWKKSAFNLFNCFYIQRQGKLYIWMATTMVTKDILYSVESNLEVFTQRWERRSGGRFVCSLYD